MCGIAGTFEFRTGAPVDRTVLQRMTDVLAHRGPDASGLFVNSQGDVGLGHRRLSIIDLSSGGQPMADAAEELWIVFNGEIYNFPELKRELQGRGHRFRTASDTEVILVLYKQEGEEALVRLNGIFAFALYDSRRRRLVLARDHFGVKPLYYTVVGGTLVFGSELKAILEHPAVSRRLDVTALNSFLTYRYNPSPRTLLEGICKLPPAHMLTVDAGGEPRVCPFWRDEPRTPVAVGEEEAVEEYSRLLEAAVKRQMISDVPVGLLLSGGIDSAVVGRLMQQAAGTGVKTFTIGFRGAGDYNELDDARATAALLGTDHEEIELSAEEYLAFFPRSFQYTEEPIAEPTIPALYYVSRLARSRVKVVLAGQGADEPLAGYDRYVGEYYLDRYAPLFRHIPLEAVAALLPRNERFKRAAYANRFDDCVERFLAIYTIFTPAMKDQLLLPDVRAAMRDVDREPIVRLLASTKGLKGNLAKLLYLDARLSLPDNLLLFGDKMSMANSLEMRVPFLDLELMRFLESLPASLKLRGRTGKYLHKKALRRWLPPEIIARKKRGFATPMDRWLQHELVSSARRLLNAPGSATGRYFRLEGVNEMLEKHQARRENFRRHIFALLCFELWHQVFLDRNPAPAELFMEE
ncbi:MAG TPA: asparagine synthase (glutamine-hydrolyzing) [Bacteroidota bacterium]